MNLPVTADQTDAQQNKDTTQDNGLARTFGETRKITVLTNFTADDCCKLLFDNVHKRNTKKKKTKNRILCYFFTPRHTAP